MCFKISLQKTAEKFTSAVSNFIEVVIVLMINAVELIYFYMDCIMCAFQNSNKTRNVPIQFVFINVPRCFLT